MYDVWSMGCVLFIIVCASMPFDDNNMRKMLKVRRMSNTVINTRTSKVIAECKSSRTYLEITNSLDHSSQIPMNTRNSEFPNHVCVNVYQFITLFNVQAQVEKKIHFPTRVRGEVSELCKKLILRMLEVSSENRPKN